MSTNHGNGQFRSDLCLESGNVDCSVRATSEMVRKHHDFRERRTNPAPMQQGEVDFVWEETTIELQESAGTAGFHHSTDSPGKIPGVPN